MKIRNETSVETLKLLYHNLIDACQDWLSYHNGIYYEMEHKLLKAYTGKDNHIGDNAYLSCKGFYEEMEAYTFETVLNLFRIAYSITSDDLYAQSLFVYHLHANVDAELWENIENFYNFDEIFQAQSEWAKTTSLKDVIQDD